MVFFWAAYALIGIICLVYLGLLFILLCGVAYHLKRGERDYAVVLLISLFIFIILVMSLVAIGVLTEAYPKEDWLLGGY